MSEEKRIGLQEAIAALRAELIESVVKSRGERMRFEVGEIKMEFQVEVERSVNAKGGMKFWVVEFGAGGGVKDKNRHKLVIPLKPVDTRNGSENSGPLLTGSSEVPE